MPSKNRIPVRAEYAVPRLLDPPVNHIGNAKATLAATGLRNPYPANHPRAIGSVEQSAGFKKFEETPPFRREDARSGRPRRDGLFVKEHGRETTKLPGGSRDVARSAYFKDSRCRIARSSASSSEPRKTSSFSSIVARCPGESDVCGSTC